MNKTNDLAGYLGYLDENRYGIMGQAREYIRKKYNGRPLSNDEIKRELSAIPPNIVAVLKEYGVEFSDSDIESLAAMIAKM
jgi:hypothetical protein